jgi:hypothetical protein
MSAGFELALRRPTGPSRSSSARQAGGIRVEVVNPGTTFEPPALPVEGVWSEMTAGLTA